MIVAEVEPIGGFVGGSISEPLLQGGILLSVLGRTPWHGTTSPRSSTPIKGDQIQEPFGHRDIGDI
jgi:hypothetical protein